MTENTTNKQFTFDVRKYFNPQLDDGENTREVRIRILPLSATNAAVYAKVVMHSLKVSKRVSPSGFKSFFCLNDSALPIHNPNVKCPLCLKTKQLYEEATQLATAGQTEESKVIKAKANNMRAKNMYIVRLIERGKEDEGPKFWRFKELKASNDVLTQLLNVYNIRNCESIEALGKEYNIFDLNEGRDLILTYTRVPATSPDRKDSISVSINDVSINTPLSKDPQLIATWINDPTEWQKIFSIKGADYLSVIGDGSVPVWNSTQKCYVPEESVNSHPKSQQREEQPMLFATGMPQPQFDAFISPDEETDIPLF